MCYCVASGGIFVPTFRYNLSVPSTRVRFSRNIDKKLYTTCKVFQNASPASFV